MNHPAHVWAWLGEGHALADVEDAVARMSDSRLGLWSRCSFAWFMRYIAGIKERPSASLALGRAWDETTTSAMRRQLTGQRSAKSEVVGQFEHLLFGEIEQVDLPETWDTSAVLTSGSVLAGLWLEHYVPRIEPLEVQPKLGFAVPANENEAGRSAFEIVGMADAIARVDGRLVIIDNKTAGKKWGRGDAQDGTQPAIYAAGALRIGHTVIGAEYHVAVFGRHPVLQRLTRPVGREEISGVIRRTCQVVAQIRATAAVGAWAPNRSHFLCSRRWCGYWRTCEHVFGPSVKP